MTSDAKRGTVRIYRAADAPTLADTDLGNGADFAEHPDLQAVTTELVGANGVETRVLARQTPEEGGFSLLYLWFKPNYPLFRHRHESDCMYVVISGSAIMGNQTLRAGDCFFVGAYAPYAYTAGPDGVEVLEVRHNVESFTTIFASNTDSRIEEAREAVRANGHAWEAMTDGPLLAANQDAGA